MAKPRNKKYVPRYENRTPLTWKITPGEINMLHELGTKSCATFVVGKATQRTWCDLICRFVVGRKLAIDFFNEEDAAELLHNMVRRMVVIYALEMGKPEGTWAFDQALANDFNEGLDLVNDMIKMLTRKEYVAVYEPISKLKINVLANDDIPWVEYKQKHVK